MKKILALILSVAMLLCFAACGDSEPDVSSSEPSSSAASSSSTAQQTDAFKVKVVDADGNAVSGVMLQVCKDTCLPAMTDASGVATFNLEITSGYKLSVMSCPEGYVYEGEAEVYLEDGATEYTLELAAE